MLDPEGRPVLGAFTGPLPPVRLGARHDGLRARTFRRKRWLFLSVQTDTWLFGMAVVHLGYIAKSFAYAFDGTRRRIVATKSSLGPTAACRVGETWGPGAVASYRFGGLQTRLARSESATDELRASVSAAGLEVAAAVDLAGAPATLAVVVHPNGDRSLLNANEKRLLLPTRGVATVNGREISLDGGFGAYDYTHGVLPRRTQWRWVSFAGRAACGTPLGLNLVEGFNGEPECAAWIGDELVPLGEGIVSYDRKNPRSSWSIKTRCGAVDLTLDVGDLHQETTNFKLVAASFTQATGHYSGTVTLPGRPPLRLEGVLGVAEDQDTLW
jgi:hypothetical protein